MKESCLSNNDPKGVVASDLALGAESTTGEVPVKRCCGGGNKQPVPVFGCHKKKTSPESGRKPRKSCCSNNGSSHSYAAAMVILAMGYLNNFAATFFVSVTANLVYWWSTAALVLFSFQVDRERFFDFNASGIVHAVVVPLMVLLFWRFSMLLWPVGMGSVVGHVALALVVQMGYWQLVHHAFAAKISWQVLFFVGVCTLAIGCSGIWLPHVVAVVSCISVALGYQRFAKQQGTVALNGALSLAMGVSWAYSVFVLAMGTYAGMPVQGLFFCDCWKTMGVVMLADKLRGDLSHAASGSKDVGNQNQSLNLMLQRMVPQVLAAAYLSAVLWAFYLPMSGWILPVQVFATVLVTACPCVASLAVPLVNFFERFSRENMNAVFAQKKLQTDSSVLERCVQRNIGIVKWYYFLSLSMACGGSYALWGIWMTPLSAGLMMLAGQVALMVHTSGFFLLHHLQSPRVLSGIESDSGGQVDASSLGAAHASCQAQQGQSARKSFDTSHDNPLALEQHTDTSSSYGDRVSSSQGVFHAGGDQNKQMAAGFLVLFNLFRVLDLMGKSSHERADIGESVGSSETLGLG